MTIASFKTALDALVPDSVQLRGKEGQLVRVELLLDPGIDLMGIAIQHGMEIDHGDPEQITLREVPQKS